MMQLVQHGAIWYNMDQYGVIRCNMVQDDAIWCTMVQYDALLCNMAHYDAIQDCVLWYNMVFQQSPRLFAKSTTDPLSTNPIKSIAHPSNLIHSLIITFFYMIVDNPYNDNDDIQ